MRTTPQTVRFYSMARKSYVDVPLGDVRQIQLDDGRIILEGIDPETGRKLTKLGEETPQQLAQERRPAPGRAVQSPTPASENGQVTFTQLTSIWLEYFRLEEARKSGEADITRRSQTLKSQALDKNTGIKQRADRTMGEVSETAAQTKTRLRELLSQYGKKSKRGRQR